MDDPPDARVRPDEEGVSALQEAVHEEEKTDGHRRRARVRVRIGVVLGEALCAWEYSRTTERGIEGMVVSRLCEVEVIVTRHRNDITLEES